MSRAGWDQGGEESGAAATPVGEVERGRLVSGAPTTERRLTGALALDRVSRVEPSRLAEMDFGGL